MFALALVIVSSFGTEALEAKQLYYNDFMQEALYEITDQFQKYETQDAVMASVKVVPSSLERNDDGSWTATYFFMYENSITKIQGNISFVFVPFPDSK